MFFKSLTIYVLLMKNKHIYKWTQKDTLYKLIPKEN